MTSYERELPDSHTKFEGGKAGALAGRREECLLYPTSREVPIISLKKPFEFLQSRQRLVGNLRKHFGTNAIAISAKREVINHNGNRHASDNVN